MFRPRANYYRQWTPKLLKELVRFPMKIEEDIGKFLEKEKQIWIVLFVLNLCNLF